MLARLLARGPLAALFLLLSSASCSACSRSKVGADLAREETSTMSTPPGTAASLVTTVDAAVEEPPDPHAWVGKRLHLWVTSCDASSSEAKQLVATATAHRGLVDGVGIACQAVVRDGSFKTVDDGPPGRGRAALAARLQGLGIATTILVANPGPGGFDGPLGAAVAMDEKARAKLVESLVAARTKEHHAGIELDLESMASEAASGYVQLVREVKAAAGTGVEISVDVHPKTVDEPGWDGPGAHDYPALADAGAIVRLMTYDLSIGPVPPGPTTKSSWVREVVAYARSKKVPAQQLEIGLPAYGYDFPPADKGSPLALKYKEIMQLKARVKAEVTRDEAGTPHFSYDAKDGRHEVWFDDAESLARVLEDLRPVAKYVRGIAIWGMHDADPRLVDALVTAGFR
ncbi:MAG: glycosyl hydrolase family 18 protein [Polyangiales bacterium]